MQNEFSRRAFLISSAVAAAGAAVGAAGPAMALNVEEARALVDQVVGDINAVIASGKPESAMIRDFEKIFMKYADVTFIAQSSLGPAGRTASKAELSAYTKAFSGYLSRKYGKRFREFIGGTVEVTGAKPLKSFFEVSSVARLQGEAPFEVDWHVFDKSGSRKFFNIIIEGVNMLASERAEIGAMLDQSGGDIMKLSEALKKAG